MIVQNILLASESPTHDNWIYRDVFVGFSRVYYVLDGIAFYEEGGRCVQLKPGHLYLTPVKKPFTLYEDPSHKLLHTYAHVTTLPAIDSFMEAEVLPNTALADAVDLWRRHIHTENEEYLRHAIELVLSCLGPERTSEHPVALDARAYIDRCALNRFDMQEMCRELGYSREHVTRSFLAAYHRTPRQYFNLKRMNVSLRRLLDGATVSTVADELGFATPYAFSKAFKAHFGLSPEKYRMALRTEPLRPRF